MKDLKPCPFCGQSPAITESHRWPWMANKSVIGFSVVCENIDCVIYSADNTYFRSKSDAIEAWNRRVENG